MRQSVALLVALVLVLAACSSSDSPSIERPSAAPSTTTTRATTTTIKPATTTTAKPTTTTTAPPIFPALPAGGPAKAVVTPTGIVLPVLGPAAGGYRVHTPCGNEAVVGGTPITGANIVLDPGHGGIETGAAGDVDGDGVPEYAEKIPTLLVARKVKAKLEADGAEVVLTRTGDYRVTLATRAEIATSLKPLAFVSIHFNGGPDGPFPKPGSETYYQIASSDSKRLAGVLYQRIVRSLSRYHVQWVADRDAGAKYRLSSSGGDYYGILRRSEGVPAAIAELAFIGNPAEARLIARADVQDVMATTLADAIVAYVRGEQGSGYVTPYARTEPAGPGGGAEGCVDPPLA